MAAEQKKPSEQYVVIRHRPGYRIRRTLILLGFSVVAAVIGYAVGVMHGDVRFSTAEESTERLVDQVETLQNRNLELTQQVINLERGRAVDQQAMSGARQTIVDLEQLISALQSEVTFFKKIMAPSEAERGLQIDRLMLAAVSSDGVYDFKTVLVQRGDNKTYLSGSAQISVVGIRQEEQVAIPIRELSEDVDESDIKLRFRYFQEIEGRMKLPEDFEPLELIVTARRSGGTQVERAFSWKELTEN